MDGVRKRFTCFVASVLAIAAASTPIYAQTTAQTVAYARQCAGCSAAQMQQKALSLPYGFGFIYDLGSAKIRKYEVFSDSTCSVGPVTEGSGAVSDGSATPTCGTFKNAYEWAVDASVQSVFAVLVRANTERSVALNGHDKIHLRDGFTNDPYTGRPFDLQQAAWEYPNGTFGRLSQAFVNMINTPASLSQVDPGLSDFIYGVQLPSLQGLAIQVGISNSGGSGTSQAQLVWDRAPQISVALCNEAEDCANFTLDVSRATGVKITYVNVTDLAANPYPSPNAGYPSTPRWTWPGGSGLDHFGTFLNTKTTVAWATCFGTQTISCSYVKDSKGNMTLIGCGVECQ